MLLRMVCSLLMVLALPVLAWGHFGMVIPGAPVLTQDVRNTDIQISFSHPFELVGMDMEKPASFFVVTDGKKSDLTGQLKPATIMDHKGWSAPFAAKRPGVYLFGLEPEPYWEPAEDCFIIHYTKALVPAYGGEDGWDEALGFPVEIIPLTRPFGNYAGNAFTGQVLRDGEPVAGAEVEVELYNQDGSLVAPSEYNVTQVVKADNNGVFTFTCPRPGWWGFAALESADYSLKTAAGEEKGVELGGVLWIYLDAYKTK